MPRYNFKCEGCGEVFSELVRNTREKELLCKKCDKIAKKIFTPPKNVMVRGTYDDYHL